MLKKLSAFTLTMILLFSQAACSDSTPGKNVNTTETSGNSTIGQDASLSAASLDNAIKNSGLSGTDIAYLLDARSVGIMDGLELTDLNGNISLDTAVAVMQNAVTLRYGTESKLLDNFAVNCRLLGSCLSDGLATRLNFAQMVFYTSCEKELAIPYKSFTSFRKAVEDYWHKDGSWRSYPNATLMGKTLDGTLSANTDVWNLCTDITEFNKAMDSTAVQYVLGAFDRMSSERVLTLYEDNAFRPTEKITAAGALLAAYHYYRWLRVNEYKALEDAGKYSKDIITDELLNQDSPLPDATNQKLPLWKGFNVDHLSTVAHGALSGMPELWTFEADIRTIAEAGGNFANVRVGWGSLSGPDYPADDQVNMAEIEYLDRIVSWGMKYGVHIQLCFTEGPAMEKTFDMQQSADKTQSVFTDPAYRELNARYWRMLAKRYADIPNKYLSFDLMNECAPINDKNYGESMAPIVAAIREESPDRVILADVHSQTPVTGESMAKMGVALCCHAYDPASVFVIMQETMKEHPDFYKNLPWPYIGDENIWPQGGYPNGKKYDGKAMLDIKYGIVSFNDVRAIAKKYNVGVMVGEFGFFGGDTAGILMESPIPRKTIYTILEDVIGTFDENGIPWCAEYRTEYTLTNSYPINKGVTYEKINGSPLYLDHEMFDFFRNIIKKQ